MCWKVTEVLFLFQLNDLGIQFNVLRLSRFGVCFFCCAFSGILSNSLF